MKTSVLYSLLALIVLLAWGVGQPAWSASQAQLKVLSSYEQKMNLAKGAMNSAEIKYNQAVRMRKSADSVYRNAVSKAVAAKKEYLAAGKALEVANKTYNLNSANFNKRKKEKDDLKAKSLQCQKLLNEASNALKQNPDSDLAKKNKYLAQKANNEAKGAYRQALNRYENALKKMTPSSRARQEARDNRAKATKAHIKADSDANIARNRLQSVKSHESRWHSKYSAAKKRYLEAKNKYLAKKKELGL